MVHLQRAVEGVTFWKLEKFWYFTDSHITIIITIYREFYDIKRNVGIVYFFFSTSSFVSNFVCFREIFAGFVIDESYYSTLSSFVTCSSRTSAA